jgi:hypothetical protein
VKKTKEYSQISFAKAQGNNAANPFAEPNPFAMPRRRTTLRPSQYEDPEDYDESQMEEGIPVKEQHFDFFKGLNDYYSPFTHLICSQMNGIRNFRRNSGKFFLQS